MVTKSNAGTKESRVTNGTTVIKFTKLIVETKVNNVDIGIIVKKVWFYKV